MRERVGYHRRQHAGQADVRGARCRAAARQGLHQSIFRPAAGPRALCGDVRRSRHHAGRRHDLASRRDHYFITTTTGNLDFVQQWLEWWLVGSGWDVHITNVTGGLAAVNLAGPESARSAGKLTDCDLATQSFPLHGVPRGPWRTSRAILLRIGFVGETGWEIHCPAESGEDLWKALLEAGKDSGSGRSAWRRSACCAWRSGT